MKSSDKLVKRKIKCPKCETLETVYVDPNKDKKSFHCHNCGDNVSVKIIKKIKSKEEDQKVENLKQLKNRKSVVEHHHEHEQEEENEQKIKKKKKLRKNQSTEDIKSEKKIQRIDKKESKENKENRKRSKKKNIKRDNSVSNLGSLINNIVTNVLGGLPIDGLENLNELQNLENLGNLEDGTIIINQNDGPIHITVNRQNISNDIYDPIFDSFGSFFDDAFRDNFSSNFASNVNGDFISQVTNIIERNQRTNTKKKPVIDKTMNKLKRFPLTKKYCQKGKNGKIEYPSCCICITEIAKGEETVLLPCGHMFHWKCCLNWLKKNNTCPMCRFEIK